MSNDPKYTPTKDGIMHEDGYILPPDEPCMLFRGKDVGSLIAISCYVEMLIQQPANKTTYSHLKSSCERLEAFINYQVNNPELNSVGCSQKSHRSFEWFIDKAKSTLKSANGRLGRMEAL